MENEQRWQWKCVKGTALPLRRELHCPRFDQGSAPWLQDPNRAHIVVGSDNGNDERESLPWTMVVQMHDDGTIQVFIYDKEKDPPTTYILRHQIGICRLTHQFGAASVTLEIEGIED